VVVVSAAVDSVGAAVSAAVALPAAGRSIMDER